jgi:hypothetical protein
LEINKSISIVIELKKISKKPECWIADKKTWS